MSDKILEANKKLIKSVCISPLLVKEFDLILPLITVALQETFYDNPDQIKLSEKEIPNTTDFKAYQKLAVEQQVQTNAATMWTSKCQALKQIYNLKYDSRIKYADFDSKFQELVNTSRFSYVTNQSFDTILQYRYDGKTLGSMKAGKLTSNQIPSLLCVVRNEIVKLFKFNENTSPKESYKDLKLNIVKMELCPKKEPKLRISFELHYTGEKIPDENILNFFKYVGITYKPVEAAKGGRVISQSKSKFFSEQSITKQMPRKQQTSTKKDQTPAFKKTDSKTEFQGKMRTVYIRAKDGARCVRMRDENKKMCYKKLRVPKQKGGSNPVVYSETPHSTHSTGSMPNNPIVAGLIAQSPQGLSSSFTNLASSVQNGGCGCASTAPPPAMMRGGGSCGSVPASWSTATADGGAIQLEKNKRKELYQKAKKYSIKGRSRMNKSQLAQAVRAAHKVVGERIRRSGKGKTKVNSAPA
jgi:hypothetical protein